jgi:hypothetical protein
MPQTIEKEKPRKKPKNQGDPMKDHVFHAFIKRKVYEHFGKPSGLAKDKVTYLWEKNGKHFLRLTAFIENWDEISFLPKTRIESWFVRVIDGDVEVYHKNSLKKGPELTLKFPKIG